MITRIHNRMIMHSSFVPFVNLSEKDEDVLEGNLTWLFCSPRSGSSWLATELLSSKMNVLNEPLIGEHIASSRELKDTYITRIEEFRDREDYFFNQKYQQIWKPLLKKLILNRIAGQFPNINSKTIIKEPNGSMAADIISDIFPKSKIIVLFRDGRDVLNSNIALLSDGGFVVKKKTFEPLSGERRIISIKIHAKKWVKLMDILNRTIDSHDEKLRLVIRYEELRTSTIELLKKIFNFLEIEINEKELIKIISEYDFEKIPSSSKGIGTDKQFAKIGIWQERFNENEKEIMSQIMGEKLKELNYQ